jgi:hypothetical protein
MTLPHKSKKPSPAAPGEWLQKKKITMGCASGKGHFEPKNGPKS